LSCRRHGRNLRAVLRKILIALLALGVLVGAAGFILRHDITGLLSRWVAGPAFNRMLSQAVANALKVDGQFGPLELQPDLSVTAEGFTSKGWPGQAIGSLDTTRARGWFDPWAVFRGQWSVPRIDIDRATFRVINPDDKLKAEDPVLPPKPWYAFLMPSQFTCGWIECPDMTIELPLGPQNVRGENLRVGATMIGKNFKYFGKGGRVVYPDYPALEVDALEVYVTREVIDIGYLYLRQPRSPRSNLQLALRLGQHADKSVKATATINRLDIVPFLPADVAKVLGGELSGTLDFATDPSGKHSTGSGTVSLGNGVLHDWDYLDQLAARSGDPSLQQLVINEAAITYALEDKVITVSDLAIRAGDSITASGRGSWNTQSSDATLSLEVAGVPLGAYLPPNIAGSLRGTIGGTVDWAWHGTEVARGTGGGALELQDAKLSGFRFQAFLDRFLKSRDYAEMNLSRAAARWRQDETGLYLEDVNILAPGQAGLRGSVHIAPDGGLSGTILAGLPDSALHWLPGATETVFDRQEDGLHWCAIQVSGTERKPKTNFTEQVLSQLKKHPIAMAELAARGISWWLGDILHTKSAEEEG
jgi:hypothetical protein